VHAPTLADLRHYFERRRDTALASQPAGSAETLGALVRHVLFLTERALRASLGPHHYQLSVFVDAHAPRVLAYYDSACGAKPRSSNERAADPGYYSRHGYEVARLLASPTAKIRFIPDTRKAAVRFVNHEQHDKIASAALYCFDQVRPAALVLTADKRNALRARDRFVAELVQTAGLAVQAELELHERRAQSAPGAAGPGYSWIHVSDVHVGAASAHRRFDQRRVCAALVKDVRRFGARPRAVFVTGDLAFRAAERELADAAKWLKALGKAASVEPDRFYLVPGNHDVDRTVADRHRTNAYHMAARADARRLDEYLASKPIRGVLLRKLAAYQRFVRRAFPAHPRGADTGFVEWCARDELSVDGQSLRVRLVGLCTVWVSDSADAREGMLAGRRALDEAARGAEHDDLVVVLGHHPPEWMPEPCRQDLRAFLASRRHVHLCGHVHRRGAAALHRIGQSGNDVRLTAGAAHDEDAPGGRVEHTYAWGRVRRLGARWQLGWAPRVYVPERDEFRADRTRYDLDAEGFAWADPWEP
jgi:calcineurin-like phosphoesterase family protein